MTDKLTPTYCPRCDMTVPLEAEPHRGFPEDPPHYAANERLKRLRRREDDQDADVRLGPPRPPARGTIDRVEGDRGYRPSATDLEGM